MSDASLPWLAVGFGGQALFGARVLVQWIASERARSSVVPPAYWWLSVAGSILVVSYAASTRDPVLLAAPLVNLSVYVRNLVLQHRRRAPGPVPTSVLVPVALVLAAFAVVVVVSSLLHAQLFAVEAPRSWVLVGAIGSGVWSCRYLVQWWHSERLGRSVLPAGFWWTSVAGSVLLFAYAVERLDWVFVCAYGLSPVPPLRNLVLIAREQRARTPGALWD
jgi:lipid-A-disaccharide synthase-like uncharacterized protein